MSNKTSDDPIPYPSQANETRGPRVLTAFCLLSFTGLFLFSVWLNFTIADGQDKLWLLYIARRWLAGKKIYADAVEVNPPLIILFYSLAARLADGLHLKGMAGIALCGYAATFGSTAICIRLLKLHPLMTAQRRKECAWALVFFLTIGIPSLQFFGREHIFLLLTLPYFLSSMPGLRAAPVAAGWRAAIGILGGIGFCMKPHCLLIFAGMQAIEIVRTRTFRSVIRMENILILLCIVLFALYVFICLPDYVATILPMALATYSALHLPEGHIDSLLGLIALGLFIAGPFHKYSGDLFRADKRYFKEIFLLALLYGLTNNGWAYTYLPALFFITFLSLFVYWQRAEPGDRDFARFHCILGFFLVGIYTANQSYAYLNVCTDNPICRQNEDFRKELEKTNATSFATFSTEWGRWIQLADKEDSHWGIRFNTLWMLPRFFLSDSREFTPKHQWITNYSNLT